MAKAAEKQLYTRSKLVSKLLQIKHGDLSLYVEDGLAAAKADPDMMGHFIAWNQKNGKVRDSKVALPPIALRGLTSQDKDLGENAVAHMLALGPRELVRAYDFSAQLTKSGHNVTGGFRRLIEQGLKLYLETREANNKWWDRTVLQHRSSMKRLYRLAHKKPSARAQAVLFDREYPKNSIFTKVANLKTMTPEEAASVILAENLPFEVAVGAVAKAKDKSIILALIEGMTGNQIITNTQMLQKLGVMNDPVLKASYDAALVRAQSDKKVETLKAGRAAERVKGTKAAGSLERLQETKTAQLGNIEGDWLVLGDCSGSMETSIEVARQIAGLITERVSGSVYLVFFNTAPTFFEVTGKSYAQIVEMTRRVNANGGTSIGCGLDYLRAKKAIVNGIAIVSDGGDNTAPRFDSAYKKYCAELEVEPTVYFFHVPGDVNALSGECAAAGIQLEEFELGKSVDYYSLPGLISVLKTNRYQLFDDVMATPLLTFNDVFSRKELSL